MCFGHYPNPPTPSTILSHPREFSDVFQPGSAPQVPRMNRLLVALAFAAAVPSVGFRMTGCDGYYDGSFCPSPDGTWPQFVVDGGWEESRWGACHYYFTCVGGEVTVWFQPCPKEQPFFDPVTLECVKTGECLCPY